MNFEKLFHSLPANGWLTIDEARLLWNCVTAYDGSILEVGCYYGRSTCLLAATGRQVYTVDPFDHFDSDDPSGDYVYSRFLQNLEERGIINVQLFRCRIEDWVVLPVDFAYLDGSHTYTSSIAQIRIADRAGVHGFCMHDYANDGGGLNIVNALRDCGITILEHVGRMAYCENRHVGIRN